MALHELTDWPSLRLIASRRGIEEPQSCRLMCGQCGVELTPNGLVHWPDCDGDWSQILFLKQNPDNGEWLEVGGGREAADLGPLAFSS